MNCLSEFRAHPAAVGQTYLQHLLFALRFGGRMLVGGIAALLHAFVPCWFPTTASRTVAELHARIGSRRNSARSDQAFSSSSR